jgi:hypothetical protein
MKPDVADKLTNASQLSTFRRSRNATAVFLGRRACSRVRHLGGFPGHQRKADYSEVGSPEGTHYTMMNVYGDVVTDETLAFGPRCRVALFLVLSPNPWAATSRPPNLLPPEP